MTFTKRKPCWKCGITWVNVKCYLEQLILFYMRSLGNDNYEYYHDDYIF